MEQLLADGPKSPEPLGHRPAALEGLYDRIQFVDDAERAPPGSRARRAATTLPPRPSCRRGGTIAGLTRVETIGRLAARGARALALGTQALYRLLERDLRGGRGGAAERAHALAPSSLYGAVKVFTLHAVRSPCALRPAFLRRDPLQPRSPRRPPQFVTRKIGAPRRRSRSGLEEPVDLGKPRRAARLGVCRRLHARKAAHRRAIRTITSSLPARHTLSASSSRPLPRRRPRLAGARAVTTNRCARATGSARPRRRDELRERLGGGPRSRSVRPRGADGRATLPRCCPLSTVRPRLSSSPKAMGECGGESSQCALTSRAGGRPWSAPTSSIRRARGEGPSR